MDNDPVSFSLRGAGPKTSEYAYFQKVKNRAVHGHARSLHKQNRHLKNFNVNCVGVVSGDREGKFDHNPCLSPHSGKDDVPVKIKEPMKRIRNRSSLLSENVTPVQQSTSSSLPNELSVNSEIQGSEIGIFSEKRKKIHQLARASFSEVVKLQPKGFDLVSSLYRRLFPLDHENYCGSTKDGSDKSLVIFDSKHLGWENDIHRFHSSWSDKIVPLGWSQYLGLGSGLEELPFQNCHFNRGLPFENHKSFGTFDMEEWDEFPYLIEQSREDQHKNRGFPSENHKSFGTSVLEEWDEFPYVIEESREDQHKLMIGWGEGEHISYSPDADPTIPDYSCLELSNVDHHQILENIDDGDNMYASSFSAERCLGVGLFSHNFRPASDCRIQDWREDKMWDGKLHRSFSRYEWCRYCGEPSSYESEFGCENCFFSEADRHKRQPLFFNHDYNQLL